MFIFGEVVPCHDNNTHDAAQDWYQRYTDKQPIHRCLSLRCIRLITKPDQQGAGDPARNGPG